MKGRSRINFVTFDEVLSLLRDLDPDDGPVQTDCRYYRTLRELAFCTLTGHVIKCSTPEKIEAFSRDKLNLLRSYLPFQQGRIESATLQAALEILDWPTWQALLSVVLAQLLKTPLEELPESTGLAVRDEAQALEDLWFRELRNGIWLGAHWPGSRTPPHALPRRICSHALLPLVPAPSLWMSPTFPGTA